MKYNKLKTNEYCIIGASNFSLLIADSLIAKNHKVIIIDNDKEKVNNLASKYEYVYRADATNIQSLKALNIEQIDTVIVGVSSMEESILIISNLTEFNIKKIIARAENEVQKKILKQLAGNNIDIIWPEQVMAEITAFRLMHDISLSLSFNDTEITIMKLPVTNTKLLGISVAQFELKANYSCNIIYINRNDNEIVFPVRSYTELLKNDVVTLACNVDSAGEIIELFTGNASLS